MIKRVRTKYLLVLVSAVAIGSVFVWVASHRRASCGKDWLRVSTPIVNSRTNAEAVTTAVSFSVSNAGPRSVGFQVEWFECRAKNNRALLATNQLRWVRIPLSPGTSTNLTMKVSPGTTPVEECLCCVGIGWFEPRAAWRIARDRAVIWGFKLLDIDRPSPWKPEHLAQGSVFAANIEVGDYFRGMHGLTRKQWSEELVRRELPPAHAAEALAPARAAGEALVAVQRLSLTDRLAEYEARNAFFAFCQSTTNSTRGAEPVAAPLKAAPPHRRAERGAELQ